MISAILTVLYVIACFVLIMFVLLQPGKSDTAAVFGGAVNSAAFGPRGTQTVLAKVTITAAIVFFMIAFLFSIPGLFTKRSIGENTAAQEAPASSPLAPSPPAPESTPPAAIPTPVDNSNANQPASGKSIPLLDGSLTSVYTLPPSVVIFA